jgi:DNA-directed RNA polymerase specialized sigma24 family protein
MCGRLGCVRDAERLCRHVLEPFRGRFSDSEYEDRLAELIGVCWRLAERYDPGLDKGGNFAAFAARILDRRVHDRDRSQFRTRWQFAGGTYERERPVFLSLDAPVAGGELGGRFGDVLAVREGDDSAGGGADGLARLVGERVRERAGDVAVIRARLVA